MNPYQTPREPKRQSDDTPNVRAQQPSNGRGIRLFSACSTAIFIGTGALLGMAYMLVLGARKLDDLYYVANSLETILAIGAFVGALLATAFFVLLRVSSRAIRERLNEPVRQNTTTRQNIRKPPVK